MNKTRRERNLRLATRLRLGESISRRTHGVKYHLYRGEVDGHHLLSWAVRPITYGYVYQPVPVLAPDDEVYGYVDPTGGVWVLGEKIWNKSRLDLWQRSTITLGDILYFLENGPR